LNRKNIPTAEIKPIYNYYKTIASIKRSVHQTTGTAVAGYECDCVPVDVQKISHPRWVSDVIMIY
jgi:hypothetical protein